MYYPIVRTRGSELVAFEKINLSTESEITPLFELTRSRRTSKDKEGSIDKNIKKILDISKGNTFIIDFTTEKELDNAEIAAFSNKVNGFDNWCKFCIDLKKKNENTIPCIALVANSDDEDLNKEIETLSKEFNHLALRIPLETESPLINENMLLLIENLIKRHEDKKNKFIFIFDFGLIKANCSTTNICLHAAPLISSFIEKTSLSDNTLIISSSSFPRSVTEYSNASCGCFPIKELVLYLKIKESIKNIKYGDYASIHPIMYSVFGGNWVPRIDIPHKDKYNFFRFKRDEQGYIKAGGEAMAFLLKNNISIENWGLSEIEKASKGQPSKNNPSFWISVRINIHIYNMLKNLRVL